MEKGLGEVALPEKDANPAFDRLAAQIFDSHLRFHPIDGTWLGIHGAHDEELPDRCPETHEAELSTLHDFAHRLAEIREKHLTLERSVDLRLARGGIASRILMMQRRPQWREDPSSYVEDVVIGVYSLLIREWDSPAAKAKALLGRLRQVPDHLAQARARIKNPPSVFTEIAALSARGAAPFFDQTLITTLAAEFCLPLTESTSRAEFLTKLADEEYRRAKLIDGQQAAPRAIEHFPLVEVRS